MNGLNKKKSLKKKHALITNIDVDVINDGDELRQQPCVTTPLSIHMEYIWIHT